MKIVSTCLLLAVIGPGTFGATLVAQNATILKSGIPPREYPGIVEKEGPRIVGGSESANGAYPWFGRSEVVISQFGFPVSVGSCGASLIHPQVAISAFHCLDDTLRPNFGFDITIYFGANNFDGSDALNTRKVQTAFLFPDDYDFPFYDIVLYVLDAPVTNIEPIAFNRASFLPRLDSKATAIGFGLTSDEGSEPSRLMEVDLDVVSASVCNNFFSLDAPVSESELICVFTEGKDICQGDSGGPLIATVDGVLTTFGVTSYGGTCGESPSGYIATSHHQNDLIKEVICNRLGGTPPAYCNEDEPEDVEDDDEGNDSEGGCGDFLLGVFCPFVFVWDLIVAVLDFLFGWL